ncbi:sigma factor [Companilactobacillus ginsenosidimutans]|uniref:RNA polymerase sigma-70 region 2 domain-containing protein n=1 Tax=Companilactobacillus ginsenosidimutans TaxID=1007676 RepID=A0A0H4QGB5_9LACO|nr:sigma factor [Companilactobacillus ginsenosidimutans]AKP66972.1 hypothetical protein ABM34_05100 [Companilactobacillus ginsenosidimutans]
MRIKTEIELIVQVRDYDDSEALQYLVKKYQPMIDKMYKLYWLNGYDRNDWYQESFIVCLQTCKLFDGSQGSKFANFFKMRLNNHIVSLIRAQRASKRQANNDAFSFEDLIRTRENLLDFLSQPAPAISDMLENFERLIEDMSDLELAAFQIIIGDITVEEACMAHRCNNTQLQRASSRCKSKIRKRITTF